MQRITHRIPAIAVLAIGMFLAGCARQPSNALAPQVGFETQGAADAHGRGGRLPEFDRDDFVRRVDHPYFPLLPGTVWRYRLETDAGVEKTVVEVLRDKKRIQGVECTVVRDRVYLDGALIEDTYDWFAQDEKGNVWYFGEDSKEYENGVVTSTEGSWIAGENGARPGIIMLAHPRPGMSYAQEVAPGVAEDRAQVVSLNETVTVPYGTFHHCLKTYETTPLDPASREYKYYARGIGHVLTESVPDQERTELKTLTRPQFSWRHRDRDWVWDRDKDRDDDRDDD